MRSYLHLPSMTQVPACSCHALPSVLQAQPAEHLIHFRNEKDSEFLQRAVNQNHSP